MTGPLRPPRSPLSPGERGGGEGDAAKLPDSYDSTRQKYQLYVPPAYDASKAWPIVLAVSPGDSPLGWASWRKTCEDRGVIFCAPYGTGDNVAAERRVRVVLDVLDDVRRRYHVDPDQTYLAGFGGGGRVACAVAVALPEFFGGVVAAGDGTPLNGLEYLRWRVRDRLSVALVAPGKEHPLGPYFDDMGVRCKTWADDKSAADGPSAAALTEAYAWLADDLDRRRADARARPGLAAPDEAYTNLQEATLAVDAAKAELARPHGAYRAATLLEGIDARWGRTQPADAARSMLQDLKADPVQRRKWEDERNAEERRSLAAQARLAEQLGDLRAELRAWDVLAAAHADTAEGKKAAGEAKRLAAALAAAPVPGADGGRRFHGQDGRAGRSGRRGRDQGRRPADEARHDHAGDDGRSADGAPGAQARRHGAGGGGARRIGDYAVRQGWFCSREGLGPV